MVYFKYSNREERYLDDVTSGESIGHLGLLVLLVKGERRYLIFSIFSCWKYVTANTFLLITSLASFNQFLVWYLALICVVIRGYLSHKNNLAMLRNLSK